MSKFNELNPKFSNFKHLFIFDFETNGLDFEKSRVIELGGLLLTKNGEGKYEVVETIDKLVNIGEKLPEKIVSLTGITDEMLEKDGKEEVEIYNDLNRIYQMSDVLFMAFNIQFDITFLINMFRRHQNNEFKFNKDMLDVMAIYKDFYPYPHRLDNLVKNLNVQHKNTHRASDDCYSTYLGFIELVKKNTGGSVDPYVNVVGYHPKYNVNGIKIEHVDYVAQYGSRREIFKRR